MDDSVEVDTGEDAVSAASSVSGSFTTETFAAAAKAARCLAALSLSLACLAGPL